MRLLSRRAACLAPSRRSAAPAQLHAQIGQHQKDVGRRAHEVEAECVAVQAQRADQAEMAVDERRHALVPGRDVALDRVLDDRPHLGIRDRLDLGMTSAAGTALTPASRHGGGSRSLPSIASTSAAKRG